MTRTIPQPTIHGQPVFSHFDETIQASPESPLRDQRDDLTKPFHDGTKKGTITYGDGSHGKQIEFSGSLPSAPDYQPS